MSPYIGVGINLSNIAQQIINSGPPIGGARSYLLIGDSLADAYNSGNPQTYLNTANALYFQDMTVGDMAQGGYSVVTTDGVGALWNSTTNVASVWYNNIRNALPNTTSQSGAFISLGTNDIAYVGTTYTRSQWKSYYESVLNKICTDFVNLDWIVIHIIGRHTGNNSYDFNTVREVQLELIAENVCGKIKGALEIWDASIGEAGGVHPNDAGYETLANRIAAAAYILETTGSLDTMRGPSIQSVAVTNTALELTLNLDSATDITIPTPDAEDVFRCEIVENGVTIAPTLGAPVKISPTRVNLPLVGRLQGLSPKLWHGYQTLYGLDNADPKAIKSNSVPPLPLRLSSHNLTINPTTPTDKVKLISGLQYDFNPHENVITFKTGTLTAEVESIESINGRVWNNINAGHHPVLVTGASGGKNGIKSVTTGAQLRPNIVAQASTQRVIVLCGISAPTASGSAILQLGTTSGDLQAGFQVSASAGGTLFWARNAANGFATIRTGFNNQKFIVAIVIDSDGTADIFYNNPNTPVLDEMLPKSNYAADTSLHIFGTSVSNAANNFTILRAFEALGTLGGANPTLEEIFTQFNSEYALGLSW